MGLGSVQGPSRADHVKMDPGSRARPSLRRILARLGSPPRWGSFLIFLAAAWDFFVGVFLSRCWRACCCCWAWASSKARRESRAVAVLMRAMGLGGKVCLCVCVCV